MSNLKPLLAATILPTLLAPIIPASAACRPKNIARTTDELKVIVPFAVPVAVPVAPFAPYLYSYQQSQSVMPPLVPESKNSQAVAADKTNAATANSPLTTPTSAVAIHCATCHGGDAPKAELSLEQPDVLSATDRLRAIHAVASGQMPKGTQLSSGQLQAVITELANPPPRQLEPPKEITAPANH